MIKQRGNAVILARHRRLDDGQILVRQLEVLDKFAEGFLQLLARVDFLDAHTRGRLANFHKCRQLNLVQLRPEFVHGFWNPGIGHRQSRFLCISRQCALVVHL